MTEDVTYENFLKWFNDPANEEVIHRLFINLQKRVIEELEKDLENFNWGSL